MKLIETILTYLIAFQFGWVSSWAVFHYVFYVPMRNMATESQRGWKRAVRLCYRILSNKFEAMESTEGKEKMIMSPIQVKRFGQE